MSKLRDPSKLKNYFSQSERNRLEIIETSQPYARSTFTRNQVADRYRETSPFFFNSAIRFRTQPREAYFRISKRFHWPNTLVARYKFQLLSQGCVFCLRPWTRGAKRTIVINSVSRVPLIFIWSTARDIAGGKCGAASPASGKRRILALSE